MPLAMTPPHRDAVGSYGPSAIEWVESQFELKLRWWQRLALVRILEHRADGTLCWRSVVMSASRRSGKSLLLRSLACWRMAHSDLWGETQTIVHTGSDVAICRDVQRGAWRFAEEIGWTVSRANGKEALETPEGDRWIVRAQSAVYGYNTTLALADECWDIPVAVISDGLEPSLLERSSAQLILTSTAHRRALPMMRNRIAAALAGDDGETLLLLWAALPQDDPGDPATWRAASPHWSADREKTLRAKYAAALAGEADPDLDDPDPMAGYEAQFLNKWDLAGKREARGEQLISAEDWAALATAPSPGVPDAVAIESWPGEAVSLALAWGGDGGAPVTVSVSDHDDLSSAAEMIRNSGFKRTVLVGASLAKDPALAGLRVTPMTGRTGQSVAELARLITEDAFRHDGGEHLTGQALAVRTQPSPDGPRVVSKTRADAVKAAAWATVAARTPGTGKIRLLLPTTA